MKAIHQINTKQILKEARIFLPLLTTAFLTITSAYILSSHTSTALDQKSISASVKVSDACSMQISDDGKATLDNPYEMIGGTYDDNVKNVNISMSCNDRNGFSLYAVGFSNNEIGNTNLISSANGNIPTGLDTTTLNSNWAFKFTPVTTSSYVPTIVSDSEGSFASFHKIPSTNTKVATFTDTVEVTGSSSVTATYAVGVSPYQAPDTYTGQVKFTLVHPNFANADGTINNFDVTVALTNVTSIEIDGTEYTNGEIASLAQGSTHTIAANYDDTNFTFSSWSVTPAASGTIADSTSDETTYTVVADGATLTATASANCMSTVSGTMQDFDPSQLCENVTSGTLTDSRGNVTKSYTVTKLNDGKWWMTTNLDLPGGTVLNASDSDVPSDGYFTVPTSTKTGFSNDSTAYVFNSNSTNCSSADGCYSYYSWLTATAGGKNASGTAVTGDGYNAAYSICPKGWRLPTSTTSNAPAQTSPNWKTGDFYALATAYGANLESGYGQSPSAFYINAGPGTTPGFLLAGTYGNSTFNYGGSYGYYWSSTSKSGTVAYNLTFYSSSVYSAYDNARRRGFSVRCVFDHKDMTEISTMQEMTPTIAAYTPQGTTTTLTDSRGGVTKSYTVAKLADNKVWMTTNLDLPGGTTITPADSDVAEDFTLPASVTKNANDNNLTDATQFSDNNTAYVFNSGNTANCGAPGQNTPCYSYYSYNAATAGTGVKINGNGVNATSSICPKGWRLPMSTTSNADPQSNNNWKTGDFYALATAYGANLESNYYQNNSGTFYNNTGPGTTPGFLLAGNYYYSTFYYSGSDGYYWSSTSKSGTDAYNLAFGSSNVYSANDNNRRNGFSVRCVANS